MVKQLDLWQNLGIPINKEQKLVKHLQQKSKKIHTKSKHLKNKCINKVKPSYKIKAFTKPKDLQNQSTFKTKVFTK